MGGANVAYEGTFGDLSTLDDASLFMDHNDFEQFIGFTPVNGSSNAMTVSPHDVFNTNNDSFPPSTSFTNLTTPGSTLIDTPDEDYQTSPLFSDNLGMDSQGANNWFPLFTDDDHQGNHTPAMMARTTSASSGKQIVVHPGGESNRKRSSTSAMSPVMGLNSPAVKHSDIAGVNARKRDKPLPPIVVDGSDTVALKRARNTAAARKSRAKKLSEREEMQERINALEQERDHWKCVALSHGATDSDGDA